MSSAFKAVPIHLIVPWTSADGTVYLPGRLMVVPAATARRMVDIEHVAIYVPPEPDNAMLSHLGEVRCLPS